MFYYQKQLFFCINQRNSGKRCCGAGRAEELSQYAKQKLKKLGLHEPGRFRVNTSSCLGRCDEGPVLVVYPQGTWYRYTCEQDIDDIIEYDILQNKQVTHCLLAASFV